MVVPRAPELGLDLLVRCVELDISNAHTYEIVEALAVVGRQLEAVVRLRLAGLDVGVVQGVKDLRAERVRGR